MFYKASYSPSSLWSSKVTEKYFKDEAGERRSILVSQELSSYI